MKLASSSVFPKLEQELFFRCTGARHPMVSCSLPFDQLWFSVTVCLLKREGCFGEGWDLHICGYKSTYLGRN